MLENYKRESILSSLIPLHFTFKKIKNILKFYKIINSSWFEWYAFIHNTDASIFSDLSTNSNISKNKSTSFLFR